MLAMLRLEAIGDAENAGCRGLSAFLGVVDERMRRAMRPPIRVPWVARITGRDPKYGLARDFLRGRKDYADSNSIGSRGVYLYFTLADGVYEVRELKSWRRERRYFCRASGGELNELSREEVDAWLAANTSAD